MALPIFFLQHPLNESFHTGPMASTQHTRRLVERLCETAEYLQIL